MLSDVDRDHLHWVRKAAAAIVDMPDRLLLAAEGWYEREALRPESTQPQSQGDLDRTLCKPPMPVHRSGILAELEATKGQYR